MTVDSHWSWPGVVGENAKHTRSRRLRIGASALVATGAMVLATVATIGPSTASVVHTKKSAKATWVLGAVTDLTGTGAAEGQAEKIGIDYSVNQINDSGGVGGHKLKVDFCDTQSTATGGSQCASQLAGVNTHVILMLGSLPSTQGAVTQVEKTKDLGLSIVPVLLPKSGTNVFQDEPLEKLVVAPMMKDAVAEHIHTVGIIYTSDSSGTAQLGAAESEAAANGLKVVSEPMDTTATDVTPQLTELKSDGAQLIFSATIGTATNAVLSSYHTLNYSMPIVLGAEAVTNEFFSSLSFPIPPKLYGITPMAMGKGFNAGVTKAWTNLETNFKKVTGTPIDSEASGDVYAACILDRLLLRTNAKSGPAEVKYLATHTISCLGAHIRFDQPGLNVPTGIPAEVVQAGTSAKDGWGPVRNAF